MMPVRYSNDDETLMDNQHSAKKNAQSSLSKANNGLVGTGLKVIQGQKPKVFSTNQVGESYAYGVSKAAGPTSSVMSDLSKNNMVMMTP